MSITGEQHEKDLQTILESLSRAAKGDFSTKIKLAGKNSDFDAIADGFNKMIRELRAASDNVRDSHEQLENVTRKLKRIFEASNDIILQVNKYGTFVDINKSVEDILGYSPEDLKGKHFAKSGALLPGDIPKLTRSFKDAIVNATATNVTELELKAKDGSIVRMEASTKLIRTGDDVEGAVVVLRDITRRREAEQALQEHKDRLRSIVASMEDLIFILDKDLRFVEYYQSPDHPDPVLYAEPEEYIGKSIKDIFPRDVAQDFEKAINYCLKTQQSQQLDYPWDILGATLWFSARISPVLDNLGKASGVTVVVRDNTLRTKMAKALEESEKKYRKIFENSPQGFILLDTEGHIIDVNRKICEWLGYEPEEIIGKDHILYPFLTKAGKITAMQKFGQRLLGKVLPAYELEFTKKGEKFLGEVLAMHIRDENGKIVQILAMITDITTHKKT
jgi:two-component system cell cycle sensor histidine kinase/response regulator CckA